MADGMKTEHKTPSDITQIPIVWRYELLKYLRSRRLLASVGIAFLVLALIYVLPPALGQPYSGTDRDEPIGLMSTDQILPSGWVGPHPLSAGILYRSQIDQSTFQIRVNGSEYPSDNGANWTISRITYQGQGVYVVLFMQNLTDKVVTATYEWYTSPQSFATAFLSFAGILVVICATFFGADALVSEFQNRTGYLIFPNPMKREVLFLGKFSASMTAGGIVIGLFYAGVGIMSLFQARGIDADFAASLAFAAEYLLAAMAVAYVISAVLKGTTGATVLTFFLFLMIFNIIDGIALLTGVKLTASLLFSAGVITYILIDPYPTDWSQTFPGGFNINNFYPDPATAALVMVLWTVIAIAVSLLLFRRKQLVG